MNSDQLPCVQYYLNATSKHDCFFLVGPESGEIEKIGSFKLLLMANSEPFCKMLEDSEIAEKGEISLPDIEPKTFKNFLKCIYGGCDDVIKELSLEDCVKLMYVAKKYLVMHIKEKIVSQVLKFLPLSLQDLFTALSNPIYCSIEEINDGVSKHIKKNAMNIFDDERFLSLDPKAISIILVQDSISVSEVIVWEAIVKWGRHQCNSENGQRVRVHMDSLLEFIRFRSMDLEDFCKIVIPARILTAEEVMELSSSLATKRCHNLSGISNKSGSRYVPQWQEESLYLHYYVKNATKLINNVWNESQFVELNNYRFKISIKKKLNFLSFHVSCEPSPKVKRDSSWECVADVDFIVVNQNNDCNFKESVKKGFYNYDGNYDGNDDGKWCGIDDFKLWQEVVNPVKGYIKEDSLLLLVHIKIKSHE